MSTEIILALTAFFVGGLVGITGVGGGAIMTPVLILFFGVPPVVAVATDLVFATVTKLVASISHSKVGSVDWGAAKKVWAGSLPGTLLGVFLLIYLSRELVVAVSIILASTLVITSLSMLVSLGSKGLASPIWGIVGGGFIGVAVATTSVGAGAIGMALLRSIIGDKDPRKLVGTDIVHAIPVALVAGTSYLFTGFFDSQLFLNLLVGSIPGVLIGSSLLSSLDAAVMRKVLALVLILAAAGITLNAFGII